MQGDAELKGLLGDKYTPTTHDYLLSNRRLSHSKKLEGWVSAGEMVNHGEVMIVLARPKPPAPPPPAPKVAPKPSVPEVPKAAPATAAPKPQSAFQRFTSPLKGSTKK
jgi:hypothetical protein